MVLGNLTGALCGAIQSGKFGRKTSLMIDYVVFLIGILILCLAPNFYLILLARFITGHSTASALVAAPIYSSEISQPQARKIIGSFYLMSYTSGFALSFILGK
jgi:MFS family permease